MGQIHNEIAGLYHDPDSEESHHALSVLCTRLMFLMFCEDAGLIEPGLFRDYVASVDGGHLRGALIELFGWLDTDDEARKQEYPSELLARFPYMNGGLFRERIQIPQLNEQVHYEILVSGCQEFDWSGVDPTVFGWRIRTPSATGYYEVAAQARPMMMLAETCIIGGTMDGYSHLSIAEREDIMVRWKGHEGVSQIARELHRDKSTISREIRRNGWQGPAGRRYRASTAQRKADRRRLRCRRPRLMDEPERRSLVVRLMRDEHWSPEEISGRISEERPDLAVSDSAIYRAVESGSLDCGLPGHRKAARLLRHHGKRRHRKGSQERRGKVRITHDISERPEEASSRSRTGDWEGDTVAGRQGGACLVTQVDRMSGYLVGGKAARKAHAEVNEATERALEGEAVHTVTLDRGKEFSDAEGLQEALGAPVYFCHPHHPWERGTNENTNGLLRDWFPKGVSLDDVSDSEVQEVYDSLNRRPRKRLKWKCPWEVYHRQSLHLL